MGKRPLSPAWLCKAGLADQARSYHGPGPDLEVPIAGKALFNLFRMQAMKKEPPQANTGIPRWLVIGFAVKLAIITLIVGAIVWYANA